MKIWPIIAGAGLFYGSFYADGRIPPRESPPHRHKLVEIDLPDRPITPTPSAKIFTPMLALDADGTEWVFKQNQMIEKAEAGYLVDDDPAKKLLWFTIFHYADGPVNRDLSDPDLADNPAPTAQPYSGTAPTGWVITYETVSDPPNVVAEASFTGGIAQTAGIMHVRSLPELLPPGALEAISDPKSGGDLLTAIKHRHHHHHDGDPGALDPVDPTGPVGSDPPPIIVAGGGGGGVSAGSIPEPSTWAMLIVGFMLMSLFSVGFRGVRPDPKGSSRQDPLLEEAPCRNP